MLTYFPKYFSGRATKLFFIALGVVSLVFMSHMLPIVWMVWGIAEVWLFFHYASPMTKDWQRYSDKLYSKKLFRTAFLIRVVYVVVSYYFYIYMTGTPFEFGSADAQYYNSSALYGAQVIRDGNLFQLFSELESYCGAAQSDLGYPTLLSVIYYLTGDSVLLSRIIKAALSAYMCVLLYRLASRNFGESTGRMTGIFAMLMPHFLYYCGLQIKETEMVFLVVAFLERTDYVLRMEKMDLTAFFPPFLLAGSLFFFRTVLGATAMLSFSLAVVMTSSKVVQVWKKVMLGVMVLGCVGYFMGGSLVAELEEYWNRRESDQKASIQMRVKRGNEFAKYAGAAVFAPLIFTIPFPTVVEVPHQELQMQVCGNNYVKNIMSFFTILAIFLLIIRGDWRKHTFVLSFLIGYLAILVMSPFAQSERFHLPILPVATMLSAYGVSQMNNKFKRYFNYWTILMFVAVIAWSWFKLKGRGMI